MLSMTSASGDDKSGPMSASERELADRVLDEAIFAFEDERFERIALDGARVPAKDFTHCTFRNAKLASSSWEKCVFEDCRFEGCDLSNFDPKKMVLRGVEFVGCKLIGVTWTAVASEPMVTFTECAMRYQSWVGTKLRSTLFKGCSIVESTFVEVDLARAKFIDCDLGQTQFERCDLGGTDFSSARGVYFDVAKNRAKGACINGETAARIAIALGLVVDG